MIEVVKDDTLKVLRFKLIDYDETTGIKTATNLTGCTAQIKYRIAGGTQKVKTLDIQSPETDGICTLAADATNFDAEGRAEGRVYITSSGNVGRSFKVVFKVVAEE